MKYEVGSLKDEKSERKLITDISDFWKFAELYSSVQECYARMFNSSNADRFKIKN